MTGRDGAMMVFGYAYRRAEEIKESGGFADMTTMELTNYILDLVVREREARDGQN